MRNLYTILVSYIIYLIHTYIYILCTYESSHVVQTKKVFFL